MDKFIDAKRFVIVNFIIVFYFVIIYSLNFFNINYTIIGVFRELLTIPFLLLQLIFFVFGFYFLRKRENRNFWTILSFLLLVLSTIFTFKDFFN